MRRHVRLAPVLILAAVLFSAFKGSALLEQKPVLSSVIDSLKAQKTDYYLFSNNQDNQVLVVPKFGARALAAFVGGANLFWTHPDALQGQGGLRTWIAPQGGNKGFIFRPDWKGTRDYSGLDPGSYKVVSLRENREIVLATTFRTVSNDGKEKYDLTLTKELRLEDDPLKEDPDFRELHYQYLGMDFVHRLRNNAQSGLDKIIGLWGLIQVPPKGTMVIPVTEVKKEVWRATYFEPLPGDFVEANPDSFSFFIHGSRRYKVGIRPEAAKGIIAYVSKTAEGGSALVMMSFPVKPEARYPDKPMSEQETNGDAIQLYSHSEPGVMAFGELECHSWALDLPGGAERAFPIKIYLYKGPSDVIIKIGKKLVCAGFSEAHIF